MGLELSIDRVLRVILIDLQMPVLDGRYHPGLSVKRLSAYSMSSTGVKATEVIRNIERDRAVQFLSTPSPRHVEGSDRCPVPPPPPCVKIFALSGLASKDDKIRAFNVGVDG